jgi:hypothetical protein
VTNCGTQRPTMLNHLLAAVNSNDFSYSELKLS